MNDNTQEAVRQWLARARADWETVNVLIGTPTVCKHIASQIRTTMIYADAISFFVQQIPIFQLELL
jgi:hypothetical protein